MDQNHPQITIPPNQYLNKVWRINNLYKIRTKDKGIQTFKLNPIQINVLKDIAGQKPVRHFSLKTRQVGLSTFWLIYWLDDTKFRDGVITGVMAHKLENISHLASIIKIAIESFPGGMEILEDNKTKISFPNNSEMIFSLEFRSVPLHNLHISEWCFCENERIWATQGAINKWTNISGESTGKGMGNDGYNTWMDAKEGKNDYRIRFIPWYAHEEYSMPLNGLPPYYPDKREREFGLNQQQIHFRRQLMAKIKDDFFVEYPETEEDAFAQAGTMFFNNRKIIVLAREARKMVAEMLHMEQSDRYTIFEQPNRKHRYVIGADVSEGIGNDFSSFKVLCLTCRQEAMSYRAHVGIDTFYKDLDKWGRAYNDALLGVERNNHGHAILLGLRNDCNYPNLYHEDPKDAPIIRDMSKARPELKYGWQTTATTKETMCAHLKLAVEGDSEEDENNFQPDYRIYDLQFLSECLTFERDGNKLGATIGKNDDTIISSAIAYQMYLKLKQKMVRGETGLEKVMIGVERNFK